MVTKRKIRAAVKDSVVNNWLTSVIGVLGGVAYVALPIIQGMPANNLTTKDYVVATFAVLMGLSAKQGGKATAEQG